MKKFNFKKVVLSIFAVFLPLYTLYSILYTPALAQEAPPTLEIKFPADGYVFEDANNLSISFNAPGFLFVDFKNNREPFPGNSNAGHAHLWVVPADFKGELNHDSAEKILQDFRPEKFTVEAPGKYRAIMELTQNNHLAYDPPIATEVVFRVGAPSVTAQLVDASNSSPLLYIYAIPALLLLLAGVIVRAIFFSKSKPAPEKKQLFNIK